MINAGSPMINGGADADVIIIGSGLGGLSAGAYLAVNGYRVAVLEAADGLGGYAHGFEVGGRTFDPAIHVIAGADPGGTVDVLLRYLGCREDCTFLRSDELYRVVIGDTVLDAPFGAEQFVESYVRAFPQQEQGIRAFFGLCGAFLAEARQLPVQLPARALGAALERLPTYFAHRTKTLGEVLNRYVTDPLARTFCVAGWPYLGLPPSELSFELFARFLFTQLNGLYHCQGGFMRLVEAMSGVITRRGGMIITGAEVERIRLEDGRVRGVVTADGRELAAPRVISNADARTTFDRMVPPDSLPPAYRRRLSRLEPSTSMFIVYAATTRELAPPDGVHETFVYTEADPDLTYARYRNGEAPGAAVVVPTILDPSLAPAGEHLITSTALAPYTAPRPWPELKPVLQEAYLDVIESVYPGFRDGLTFVSSSTPLTLERFTRNHRGAAYGWANTPAQAGSKRLAYPTPIGGLYLAGHWAQAASALRVIVSGGHVAQLILREDGCAEVGPDL